MSQKVDLDLMQEINYLAIAPEVRGLYLYYFFKRITDFILATLFLLVISPLIAVIALIIVIDSPGPAIIAQKRIGARRIKWNGSVYWQQTSFNFYKLRSMRNDTSSELHRQFIEAFIAGDEARMAAMQQNSSAKTKRKLVDDPRVTRIGRLLRKSSLDELPQLWNVIMGDMSMVGPRPALPYEVELYHPWHHQRLTTVPGITGLWQVNGRSSVGFDEMVNLDIEYIRRQSLWLDFVILLQTIPVVLLGKGAE